MAPIRTDALPPAPAAGAQDPMPLDGIDHIELYVGNATQAAYFFSHAYGFTQVAHAGLETGRRESTSRVLVQGRIRLVLTGALGSQSEVAAHHRRHGDSVRDVAFGVPDARLAWEHALAHGAQGTREPCELTDEHGSVRLAQIHAYGDTLHTFVERTGYTGAFMPGYEALPAPAGGADAVAADAAPAESEAPLFESIDHVVGNVERGRMDEWIGFYERVLGMRQMVHFGEGAISTSYSALMSKVVTDGAGRVKLPINEPAEGRRRSQIDEYLDFHEGAGAQHIALTTPDIVASVDALRRRGVRFLSTPDSYYATVPERVGEIDESLQDLRRLGILVDRDDEGYMLQIFTEPLGDRPTIFFELIERHGARGFGEGNFKALFEAIEREQARRGNL